MYRSHYILSSQLITKTKLKKKKKTYWGIWTRESENNIFLKANKSKKNRSNVSPRGKEKRLYWPVGSLIITITHTRERVWSEHMCAGSRRQIQHLGLCSSFILMYISHLIENNIMWQSLSMPCDRSVVFFGSSGLLHQYNCNIVESGVKHQKTNQPTISRKLQQTFHAPIKVTKKNPNKTK